MSDAGCLHPIIFDVQNPPGDGLTVPGRDWHRLCAFCTPHNYNRTVRILRPLRKQCEKAWRIDYGRLKKLSNKDAMDLSR